jgi:hypothetical protein
MNGFPVRQRASASHKGPKTTHILIGLIRGAAAGVAANLLWGKTVALAKIVHYGTEPAGQLWLRALIGISDVCLTRLTYQRGGYVHAMLNPCALCRL